MVPSIFDTLKMYLAHLNNLFQLYDIATGALNNFKKHLTYALTDTYDLILIRNRPNVFVCGCLSLPSDIHRSIIYAYHRKYLNIIDVGKLVQLRQFPFLEKIYSFFERYIRTLYFHYVYLLRY